MYLTDLLACAAISILLPDWQQYFTSHNLMFTVVVLVNVPGLDCHVGINNIFLLFFGQICKVYVIQNSPILGQGRSLVPRGFPCPKLLPLGHRKDGHCEEAQTQGTALHPSIWFNLAIHQTCSSIPVDCTSDYFHFVELYFFQVLKGFLLLLLLFQFMYPCTISFIRQTSQFTTYNYV